MYAYSMTTLYFHSAGGDTSFVHSLSTLYSSIQTIVKRILIVNMTIVVITATGILYTTVVSSGTAAVRLLYQVWRGSVLRVTVDNVLRSIGSLVNMAALLPQHMSSATSTPSPSFICYSCRVIVISADTTGTFKRRLDKFWLH